MHRDLLHNAKMRNINDILSAISIELLLIYQPTPLRPSAERLNMKKTTSKNGQTLNWKWNFSFIRIVFWIEIQRCLRFVCFFAGKLSHILKALWEIHLEYSHARDLCIDKVVLELCCMWRNSCRHHFHSSMAWWCRWSWKSKRHSHQVLLIRKLTEKHRIWNKESKIQTQRIRMNRDVCKILKINNSTLQCAMNKRKSKWCTTCERMKGNPATNRTTLTLFLNQVAGEPKKKTAVYIDVLNKIVYTQAELIVYCFNSSDLCHRQIGLV